MWLFVTTALGSIVSWCCCQAGWRNRADSESTRTVKTPEFTAKRGLVQPSRSWSPATVYPVPALGASPGYSWDSHTTPGGISLGLFGGRLFTREVLASTPLLFSTWKGPLEFPHQPSLVDPPSGVGCSFHAPVPSTVSLLILPQVPLLPRLQGKVTGGWRLTKH